MKPNTPHPTSRAVKTGADRLLEAAPELIKGKRVGLLTNHTGRRSDGTSTIEAIAGSGICRLTTLFGPEHGLAGEAPDGVAIKDNDTRKMGARVYSLYGETMKPTPSMLGEVDVLVCDIQDVGARFYTYLSTILLAMGTAAEAGIPVVILDRPNPIRGLTADGPVLDPAHRSFVGWLATPITTGITIGELCLLSNKEGWLGKAGTADLHVVPLEKWKRSMWFDETGLPWIAPSPNMQTISTAAIYPGMCLVEGTNISEGRGTSDPFHIAGAPWADPDLVLRQLDRFEIRGVRFAPEHFTPTETPGRAHKPKYEGVVCHGIRISITNRDLIAPVRLGISVLDAFRRAHPDQMTFDRERFDNLAGNSPVREELELGVPPDKICAGWENDLKAFGEIRSKYLLYP